MEEPKNTNGPQQIEPKVITPNATNTAPTSGAASVPEKPYMEMEFEEFLQKIGEGNLSNWSIMAEVLGVDRTTITRWKKTPAARQAIKGAIAEALQNMQVFGAQDWKMWREKLKMFGLADKQILEAPGVESGLNNLADTLQGIYKDGQRSTNPTTDKAVLPDNPGDTTPGQ